MNDQRRPRNRRHTEGDPPGTGTRRAALRLVDAILRRGDPLEIASHAATQGLSPADRAFAIAIASESLRWMTDIDAMIDDATPQQLPEDVKSRAVLRIALAQLLSLNSPAHAVVSTALPLVAGGPRRLVHALLSRAQKEEWRLPPTASLPESVAERWSEQWGDDMIASAEAAWSSAPPIDLSFAAEPQIEGWPDAQSLAPLHLRLPRGHAVESLPGFEEGGWWVQDLAASLAARLLGKGDGRTVLDLCAAPGGKTMQLAAAGWHVTAVDASAKRLERLADNLARTGLQADVKKGDLLHWQPKEQADAILLDAPCSATGIFRRHPDVLHRVEGRNIAEMADLQARLLNRATKWVKPGGTLIYATCSLERAEGEEQIETFLYEHPQWTLSPIRADELPAGITPDEQGQLRTLPHMLAEQGGMDGFFIARLIAPN
ncbi:RsmB/NOP family class I SAM-dependent RNA methyltransferase [Sphingopyxis yananensis]|uniref:RsmB/NOP family class I SAM-dependent RNA methyltransferase n=1 Tax=Sphingopyxis yananensis TaxID=2886687 RepID=UPI001D10B80C|nr:transcription antitermination factor NusB [Sphingopyxis yananensis]MCC2600903.1 methyltransferase domain-containing protein [Sphingopyxis yananensis]